MAQNLKVGFVGLGGMFHGAHLQAWQGRPGTQVTAVCDIVPEKVHNFVAKNPGIKGYVNYAELLAGDIDVVDICTPNLFHSEIAVAALQAGKHVFCEKPDAVSVEEVRKMADAAKASGKILMVMRNNRFTPAGQYLKRFVESGQMGEIYTGRCGWIRRRGIPGKGGWFTTKALSGGGPLIDLGVHYIDLTMWLMNNPRPVSVVGATYTKFAESTLSDSPHAAFGEKRASGTFDVEDLATGFIRFAGGATLQIEFSWASNIEEETLFIELRGARAGISLRNGVLKIFGEDNGMLTDTTPRLESSSGPGPHQKNILHFIDCIEKKAQPIFVPEQGVHMIQILSAIYASAQSGSEVKM